MSLDARGHTIVFLAVLNPEATQAERELLSVAAAEVILYFAESWTIEEPYVDPAPPERAPRFKSLLFKRAEGKDFP